MNCNKFQDSISEYLDGALDSRRRAECAAHRLICRECRELYTDVRATVETLNSVAQGGISGPAGLESRILAATTAGEMLSCSDFDRLIERYFDGVILAPTFQTFQAHFEKCAKCRRLMAGIEEAIGLCKEIKEAEVEVPESLHDRIVAATLGAKDRYRGGRFNRMLPSFSAMISGWAHLFWTPQMAVASLIFAASGLLVLSRFGSVGEMAVHAGTQAEMLVNEGQRAINQTGAMARTGFKRFSYGVNTLFFHAGPAKPVLAPAPPNQPPTKLNSSLPLGSESGPDSVSTQRDKSGCGSTEPRQEQKPCKQGTKR